MTSIAQTLGEQAFRLHRLGRAQRTSVTTNTNGQEPGQNAAHGGSAHRPTSRLSQRRLLMSALALMMRPTHDGWGVYLTDGQELIRYRGLCARQLALRYLQRYTRSTPSRRSAGVRWWRTSG